MEPRIFQFYSATTRAVSPANSNWSPMIPNPLDSYNPQDTSQSDQEKFPSIRRSFAFDEWDDDSSEEAPSFIASNHSSSSKEEPRRQPETLVAIPSVLHGRNIYDATQGYSQQRAPKRSGAVRPKLDTYMTVTHLDDILKTSSSTSTETSGNNNDGNKQHVPYPLRCQGIPRQSWTYRWTSATPPASNQPPTFPRQNLYEHAADEASYSTSESEPPCPPIPAFITVYKNE